MLRKSLLYFFSLVLIGQTLLGRSSGGYELAVKNATTLKKITDRQNLEDFRELQKAIRRVLEREHSDIFQKLSEIRIPLLAKIEADRARLQKALSYYANNSSSEVVEIQHLIHTLAESKALIQSRSLRDGTEMIRVFFSDHYILEILRTHGSELSAAKTALIYILERISKEAILNIKALELTYELNITNFAAKRALEKVSLFSKKEGVLLIPNSGFVHGGYSPQPLHFKGTDEAGFAGHVINIPMKHLEISSFIDTWKFQMESKDGNPQPTSIMVAILSTRLKAIPAPQSGYDLEAGDLIVTEKDIYVVEQVTNNLQEIPVIYNTRKADGSKEGIVDGKLSLPQTGFWVLRIKGR